MRSCFLWAILIFLIPDIAYSATEYATFESFYKESSTIGWVVAGLVAVIAAAAIFFTGGTASPIVVSIGTWVGGMMGLSGIAATKAGLALLGGGSIASGGFGIIGGTALLTAALSFSSEVVFDYTIGKAYGEYKYSNLLEQSKEMPTLPLPVNESGPDGFEDAIEILKNIDNDLPVFSNKNKKITQQAIASLIAAKIIPEKDGLSKNTSLLALLYFVSNDYDNAKKYANIALQSARELKIRGTLPAFIYATSSLYEETFDFSEVTKNYFSYSILAEPNNPLIPFLFSIYLDRVLLRFNDGYLDEGALRQIYNIMQSPSLEDTKALNYISLLSRYFMLIKLEQQKILALSKSTNKTIKNSPKTLSTVKASFKNYSNLTNDANNVVRSLLALQPEGESRVKANEFRLLLLSYRQDRKRLKSVVNDLRNYQKLQANPVYRESSGYLLLISIFLTPPTTSANSYNPSIGTIFSVPFPSV